MAPTKLLFTEHSILRSTDLHGEVIATFLKRALYLQNETGQYVDGTVPHDTRKGPAQPANNAAPYRTPHGTANPVLTTHHSRNIPRPTASYTTPPTSILRTRNDPVPPPPTQGSGYPYGGETTPYAKGCRAQLQAPAGTAAMSVVYLNKGK